MPTTTETETACPRCAGLGRCRVYSFTAQKLVEGECPVCEGSGEVEAPKPVVDLIGTAAVAIAL